MTRVLIKGGRFGHRDRHTEGEDNVETTGRKSSRCRCVVIHLQSKECSRLPAVGDDDGMDPF